MPGRQKSEMITIPYRIRQLLRNLFSTVLIALLAAAFLFLLWLLWLNRFVVYTRDGAIFDFGINLEIPEGEAALPPTEGPGVDIFYNEGADAIDPVTTELKQLSGCSISAEMLQGDINALCAQVEKLPAGTAVLIDVKNIRGDFFYNTNLGNISSKVSANDLESMIKTLRNKGYYLIARLPAFRDYWYGLNHVSHGLFNLNKYSLWMDADRCYWLNPASEGALTYLRDMIFEIRNLGFDEVVFYDFCFPDTDKIFFEGDKAQAIQAAAMMLVKACASDTFAVSFTASDGTFPLPEGRSRLYFSGISAAQAATLAGQTGLENPDVRVVFLTDLRDTRFEDYGVLRPLSLEQ